MGKGKIPEDIHKRSAHCHNLYHTKFYFLNYMYTIGLLRYFRLICVIFF